MKTLKPKSFLFSVFLGLIFSFSFDAIQAAPFPMTTQDKNLCAQFEKHLPNLNSSDAISITTSASNPTSLPAGITSPLTYTFANNSGVNLLITSISPGIVNTGVVSGSISSDTCSHQTIANGGTCTFNVALSGGSVGGSTTVAPIVGIDCVLSAKASPLTVTVTAPGLITAVGQNSSSNIPLLSQSMNSGISWSTVTSGIPTTTGGAFRTTSCASSSGGTTGLCIAAGDLGLLDTVPPFLALTTNGGTSWSTASLGLTDDGVLRGSSCTGSGSSTICIASGCSEPTPTGCLLASAVPMVVETTNAGSSWTNPSISGSTAANGFLVSASCAGSSGSSLCVSAGSSYVSSTPLLVQSTNEGSWSAVSIPSLGADNGDFNASSCINSSYCMAAGRDTSATTSLLVQTTNGGSNWSTVAAGLISNVSFTSSSCSSSTCVTVGQNTVTSAPVIVETQNGGTSWSTVSGLPSIADLTSVSCSPYQSTSECVAAGCNDANCTTGTPLIIQTVDGGNTWTSVSISAVSGSAFTAVSCGHNSSSSDTVCVAGGSTGSSTPLLYKSVNGGTWSSQSVSGEPATGSYLGMGNNF